MASYWQDDVNPDFICTIQNLAAYYYDPAANDWVRWKYGDAMIWGQGPFMDVSPIDDEAAIAVMKRTSGREDVKTEPDG